MFERRLRLVPDDENARVLYALLLRYAGEPERAIEALAPILDKQNLDGVSLFNIACGYARMSDTAHALVALRRAVTAGFRSIAQFQTDPDLDPLRGMAEFKELMDSLTIRS